MFRAQQNCYRNCGGGVNKQSTAEMDTRLMQLSARFRYLRGTSLLEPALSVFSCSSPRSLPYPHCMTASVWLLLNAPLMMGASYNALDYSVCCDFLVPHSRISSDCLAHVLYQEHHFVGSSIHPSRKATCASIISCPLIGSISMSRSAEWDAACESPALI